MTQPRLVQGMMMQELLECRLCRQIIDPEKQLPFNSVIVLSYRMCPKCRQPVPELTMNQYWYRSRWYRFMQGVRKRRGWDSRLGVNAMPEPTREDLLKRIADLEKQVEGRKGGNLEFRVSDKGGVSVYGLGRFPVTLYYEQWVRLLDRADALRAFLEENKGKLKLKGSQQSGA